ncbi:family with sequence similarity 206, member a [Plakobranchus ocellatus]|uniref:Protein Abitram n=1 Tax=Plakobranchus ocellatus TaxID=259542 RepID=A0AAV4CX86_9GAST|nr:family with sequence similarity 206, member a [Plakobranchus ocellatus]
MEGEIDSSIARPPSVVDRYFQKRYKTDIEGKACEDQLILTHSNRICVICIAKSHPILAEGKTVSKVSFEGDGWSRLENTVVGKNKRGAQWLERTAPLCLVTCTDKSIFTLICCVKGQLVEINTNLETKPNLLIEKPSSDGYIAVILPGLKGFDREVEKLKSEEDYQAMLKFRKKPSLFQTSELSLASALPPTDLKEVAATVQNIQSVEHDKETVMLAGEKVIK